MADNRQREPRRGFPGGFLFFILAAILIILSIQTFTGEKTAKVSFSHQLEHLVNLDLLNPNENKKIAQNDNLVTFTGKFRQQETQDAANRYEYLELLNKKHTLVSEKNTLKEELDVLEKNVQKSAAWFLYATGNANTNAFVVVSANYDTPERQNSVVVRSLPQKEIVNLKSLKHRFTWISHNPTNENTQMMQKDLIALIQILRSPNVGIGDEKLKQTLKTAEASLYDVKADTPYKQRITTFSSVFENINSVVLSLLEDQNGVRLLGLRSVRNYVESIDRYNTVLASLDSNAALLKKARVNVANVFWFFNNKEISTKALEKQNPEEFSHWFAGAKKEWVNFANNKGLAIKSPDQPRSVVLEKIFKSQEQPAFSFYSLLFTLGPIVLVVLFLFFLFSRQMKGGVGSSAMNFGKSPAKLLTKEGNKVTFKDVAGAEESKEELTEVVDFLKDPQKFTALGARIPKGVLLVGPPGTGKTLIAKAVAGEADRPFFTISGSDFVEMFVGVGASRVRDLFDQAKKNAPCIIFMDEIDAVGRHRGAGIGGGHDEREQTLNQLLVEMDGFDTKEGVIMMAATNRPDILDKALLRPGRFDRQVLLDLPDVKGRYEILKVHARKIKIDPSVELMDIARSTPGASGADLENILNEAALLAARKGRKAVTTLEAKEACDKVRFGKERRSLEMDDEEKKTTAYHESGHTMVGLVVKHSDPVDKVTIIPRGFSLGATHFMPKKNKVNFWKREGIDQLAVLMGGRAAEEIFLEDMTSGASQDIAQATKLARAMICKWGMNENIGTVTYDQQEGGNQFLGLSGYQEKVYSEDTAKKIDDEVKNLIHEAHKRARQIIKENKDKVELMAKMLMEFETLDQQDVKEIMEGKWNTEEKKKRLKIADDLQRKLPPPPPMEPNKGSDEGPAPQQA